MPPCTDKLQAIGLHVVSSCGSVGRACLGNFPGLAWKLPESRNPKGPLSTYKVERRVSILGVTFAVWVSVPHIGT